MFGRRSLKVISPELILIGLKTIGELRLESVWVDPDQTLITARHVLLGHRLPAIGVKSNGMLVGTLALSDLLSNVPSTTVGAAMRPLGIVADGDSSIRSVALKMASEGADFIPVVSKGKFLGILTASMLLKEMSRTWDPLTGLSWSDRLREWGIERLKEGTEITVIFIDLDNFGTYNKAYGHTVGDSVLKSLAKRLSEFSDEKSDVLVRYGGDEFALGTIRTRPEAEKLLSQLESSAGSIQISGIEKPVTASFGIFGGRRTGERENVHYAATMDSLINLASKNCLARKAAHKSSQPLKENARLPLPIWRMPARLAVLQYVFDDSGFRPTTKVAVVADDRTVIGAHQRNPEMSRIESLVWATLNAAEQIIPETAFEIIEVSELQIPSGEKVVEIVIQNKRTKLRQPLPSRKIIKSDLARTVAEATLAAAMLAAPKSGATVQ